ncbi:MAG: helix-turn-helix transcriptional regulator [Ruminococcaceae bacterium]|nr:helix-turn-helix transcriptional regulator [Oscillospiraceae bacterium]
MNSNLDFRKIGSRIQAYRNEKKMTQEELSELVGTSQKYISRIEVGYHSMKLETVVAIANALQVSLGALIADYDDSTDESNLKLILDDIRGMSANQLNILRDNIQTIKKYGK